MSDIITIAGSPSASSRSTGVVNYVRTFLNAHGLTTDTIQVRDLDAHELLHARFDGATIRDSISRLTSARAVIVATPVYKAAYSGILKAFLDLLPQQALLGKVVFPIATGGSAAHLLAIDYALKPVLSALGAQHILSGLYITDSQVHTQNGSFALDPEIDLRLQATLRTLIEYLTRLEPVSVVVK